MEKNHLKNQIIRVDHAGEYAAKYIYKGQIAAFKKDEVTRQKIKEMLETEEEHLSFFDSQIKKNGVRPSVFLPLWKLLGFGLGYGSALFGKKSAMHLTSEVEDVIEKHYQDQIDKMEEFDIKDQDLLQNIKKIRREEIEHKEIGQEDNLDRNLLDRGLGFFVRLACKIGIFASKRI